MKLSRRILSIEESKTSAFLSTINQMKIKGKTVINLAIGQPSFDPPLSVLEATKAAIDQKKVGYDVTSGLELLKEKIASEQNNWKKEDILITNGAKQALFSLFQAILDPMDEVILPTPSWVSFAQQVRFCGASVVPVKTFGGRLNIDVIRSLISDKTRAIVINSPNNPTGAVYSQEDLMGIAELAEEKGIYLISDEAYGDFIYSREKSFLLSDLDGINDRLFVVRSFSKTYAMTGFRVGYVVGPSEVMGYLKRLQGHLCGNVCTFAQYGALSALDLSPDVIADLRAGLKEKRDYLYKGLTSHLDCELPDGGFYLFPCIEKALISKKGSRAFADHLLKKTGVAVIPGIEFGCEGHVRISFAVPRSHLKKGIQKIKEVL